MAWRKEPAPHSLRGSALALAPPHASSVLASCAPRPGVGAGESRARPFFSGGVGPADAALKRWHCLGVLACVQLRCALLRRCAPRSTPAASSRQRGDRGNDQETREPPSSPRKGRPSASSPLRGSGRRPVALICEAMSSPRRSSRAAAPPAPIPSAGSSRSCSRSADVLRQSRRPTPCRCRCDDGPRARAS